MTLNHSFSILTMILNDKVKHLCEAFLLNHQTAFIAHLDTRDEQFKDNLKDFLLNHKDEKKTTGAWMYLKSFWFALKEHRVLLYISQLKVVMSEKIAKLIIQTAL